MKFYDNTRLSCHRNCNRMFYFRHVRHWESEGLKGALCGGAAWHSAMDEVWAKADEPITDHELWLEGMKGFAKTWVGEFSLPIDWAEADDDLAAAFNYRNPETYSEMLRNYIEKRRAFIRQLEEIKGIERPFAVPLFPDRPDVMYVGRLDKEAVWNGKTICFEHKTTSLYAKDGGFRSTFIDNFSPSSQVDGYAHALHMQHGDGAGEIMIDAALVHKNYHDHFMFIPIDRQNDMLAAWLWEAQNEVELIERNDALLRAHIGANRPQPFLRAFGKNTENCIQFGSSCSYLMICKGEADPSQLEDPPEGFVEKKWSPFDELRLTDLGLKPEDDAA